MVDNGWLDLGYEYIVIDDCWQERERDGDRNLVEDHLRFPTGMKALGDYVNSRCSSATGVEKCLTWLIDHRINFILGICLTTSYAQPLS